MRKLKKDRKLSRKRDQRKALLKSLAVAFFLAEKIKTTEAKAKELSRFAEKLITKSKNKNLASRRQLLKFLPGKTVKKLIDDIGPRYIGRNGGCTRIIKLGPRKSNGAKMAQIELVK